MYNAQQERIIREVNEYIGSFNREEVNIADFLDKMSDMHYQWWEQDGMTLDNKISAWCAETPLEVRTYNTLVRYFGADATWQQVMNTPWFELIEIRNIGEQSLKVIANQLSKRSN